MTYQVVVTREGRNWLADVVGVEGAHTFSRRLEKLDAEVREVIAAMLDLPEGAEQTLDLAYEIHSGAQEIDERVERLRQLRLRVAEVELQLVEQTPEVVQALLANDHTVREVAFRTGLSPARVSQISRELLAG